jgi:hypothetical protein
MREGRAPFPLLCLIIFLIVVIKGGKGTVTSAASRTTAFSGRTIV